MFRTIAVRASGAVAVIAAVACCTAVSRAETVSPVSGPVPAGQGLVETLGGPSGPAPMSAAVSDAVMRALAARSDSVGYHSGLGNQTFGSQVVRHASDRGCGFERVPFESFLSVAAAPNGENVVRTFIIIENEKSKESESAPGKTAGDDLVTRFTQAAAGATTTSGSATLSILQVPPTSSSLVFTNVVLKAGAPSAE